MNKPISPCYQKCPKRSTYCRKTCEHWQKYEEAFMQYHRERRKEIIAKFIAEDYEQERQKKIRKRRRSK